MSPLGRALRTGTPLRRRLFALSAAGIVPLAVMAGFGLRALQQEQTEQVRRVGLGAALHLKSAVTALPDGTLVGLPELVEADALPPVRRAARYDGLFPIDLDTPQQLAELLAVVAEHRDPAAGPFDVAVEAMPGRPAEFEEAGATWWLRGFDQYTVTAAAVREVLAAGPG